MNVLFSNKQFWTIYQNYIDIMLKRCSLLIKWWVSFVVLYSNTQWILDSISYFLSWSVMPIKCRLILSVTSVKGEDGWWIQISAFISYFNTRFRLCFTKANKINLPVHHFFSSFFQTNRLCSALDTHALSLLLSSELLNMQTFHRKFLFVRIYK